MLYLEVNVSNITLHLKKNYASYEINSYKPTFLIYSEAD